MKYKLKAFIKLILLAFLSLIWLLFIQGEYEMIIKPELQNEFPIIKGVGAVYVLGFISLVVSVIIFYLLFSIFRSKKESRVKKG